MTPEGKVKQKVTAILVRYGVWYCMPRGTAYGRSGVPDYIGCAPQRHPYIRNDIGVGLFFAIEAKAGGNRLTPLQEREREWIERNNGKHFVIRETNVNELEQWLKQTMGVVAL